MFEKYKTSELNRFRLNSQPKTSLSIRLSSTIVCLVEHKDLCMESTCRKLQLALKYFNYKSEIYCVVFFFLHRKTMPAFLGLNSFGTSFFHSFELNVCNFLAKCYEFCSTKWNKHMQLANTEPHCDI